MVEHTGGHETRIALTPDRPVAEVTRELLKGVGRLGGAVEINPAPGEVPWTVPLDEDDQHATYDADQVTTYFAAATQAALVQGEAHAQAACPYTKDLQMQAFREAAEGF